MHEKSRPLHLSWYGAFMGSILRELAMHEKKADTLHLRGFMSGVDPVSCGLCCELCALATGYI